MKKNTAIDLAPIDTTAYLANLNTGLETYLATNADLMNSMRQPILMTYSDLRNDLPDYTDPEALENSIAMWDNNPPANVRIKHAAALTGITLAPAAIFGITMGAIKLAQFIKRKRNEKTMQTPEDEALVEVDITVDPAE